MYDSEIIGDVYVDSSVISGGSLLIKDGVIAAVLSTRSEGLAREVFDFSGNLVLPGAIDGHAHAYSNSPEAEGISRLTRAAAKGGVTTVLEMPYDRGGPITTAEKFRAKAVVAKDEAHVNVALFATIAKHEGWKHAEELIDAGAIAIKVSTYENDPERFPEIPEHDLAQLLRISGERQVVVTAHAENANLIDPLVREAREAGELDAKAHGIARPLESETTAVSRLLELARVHQGKLHIAHLTVPFGYELIRFYQEHGTDATAEACLHYLLLSEENIAQLGSYAKVHPPLRSAAIQTKLWQEVVSGGVEFVTSDHVPWTREQKQQGDYFDQPPGLPSIEVLVPLLFSEGVVKRNLSISRFVELTSENVARRYGLSPAKGRIAVGADADLMIIDPDTTWNFDASQQESIADWSPYDDRLIRGQISATFVNGHQAYSRTEGLSALRHGQLLT